MLGTKLTMRKISKLFFAFLLALPSMFSLVPKDTPQQTEVSYKPGIGKHFEAAWRHLERAVDKHCG